MNPRFTLLVVDDEKQNRTLLTELLQDDYQIILAKNGEQALERAQERSPDLILLDVLMPEMDGYAVIRALKASDATRHIPVIFVSALDSARDEELGLELGAVDYIAKPYHPPIVRVRVRNHLQSVHQRRLLEQLALIDSLTEIPNRRRFAEVYEREWRRCIRSSSPLSLIVVDVDHFKLYNDTYGHAAGDVVLKRVAKAIQSALKRPADFVARYGGEEFVVILPDIDATNGLQVGEKIRLEVENQNIPYPESAAGPHLSVSLGGATGIPHQNEVDSQLFAQADHCLYDAKHAGRNRVVWAPEPARSSPVKSDAQIQQSEAGG
ncbi:MAG: diguanylate cyclase [Rhodoferax sp.]|nr:diguanylate cyclase [Rhodoferax sp.]MCF8210030.1 diguanylate cyclase [Rhodoferax sp.]